MGSKFRRNNPHSGDGASPGKIFIGGLAKDTTNATFNQHFEKYGEITDSVVMKDRHTGNPRGFGFITYADPAVVDKVIEDNHVINGKQVEIKRTIPKGSGQSVGFKTKKIFVGGVPQEVTEDEFQGFFSKYGKIVEHQIIRDRETNRSRGFGFVIFDSEEVVDELLSKGNIIDMEGTQVEIKKAEPKKTSKPPPPAPYGSNSRSRSFNGNFGGFESSYGGFDGGFGPGPNRTPGGGIGARFGGNGSEFGGYGDFGSSGVGAYRGDFSLGYSSRFGSGLSGGYEGSGLGGYGRGEGYGSYGASSYDGGSYGGLAGGLYGRGGGGYSGSNRYHPYSR